MLAQRRGHSFFGVIDLADARLGGNVIAWIEAHPLAALIPIGVVILSVIVPVVLAMRRVNRADHRDLPVAPDPWAVTIPQLRSHTS
jgi:hypothetical protein